MSRSLAIADRRGTSSEQLLQVEKDLGEHPRDGVVWGTAGLDRDARSPTPEDQDGLFGAQAAGGGSRLQSLSPHILRPGLYRKGQDDGRAGEDVRGLRVAAWLADGGALVIQPRPDVLDRIGDTHGVASVERHLRRGGVEGQRVAGVVRPRDLSSAVETARLEHA